MMFHCHADDGPTLNAGLVACDFSGGLGVGWGVGGLEPLSPPLELRMIKSNRRHSLSSRSKLFSQEQHVQTKFIVPHQSYQGSTANL